MLNKSNILKHIIFLFIIIIISNCSNQHSDKNYVVKMINGFKNIINENKPSKNIEDLNINIKKVHTINGIVNDTTVIFTEPKYLSIDSKNNLYIFDGKTQSVKVFSSNGDYIKFFGRKGQGPGEFNSITGMNIQNDTLFLFDSQLRKILLFDTDGNFIIDKEIRKTSFYHHLKFFNKNFICIFGNFQKKSEKLLLNNTIEILDINFNNIKTLDSTKSIEFPFTPLVDEFSISKTYTINSIDKNIYIVNRYDKKKYQIRKINSDLKTELIIQKRISPITISKEEKEYVVKDAKEWIKKEDFDKYIKFHDFKGVINNLYIDKFARLWVERNIIDAKNTNNSKFYDIFKDNVYLNSIEINFDIDTEEIIFSPNNTFDKIKFLENKIYVINSEKARVSVYTY